MALNLIFRRVSSSVRPLAIRTVGSPRTFRTAISSVLCVEKPTLNRSFLVPFLRFSTKPSSDDTLIRVIDSEIDCADEPTVEEIPDGFPFKIQDNHGERTILLTRDYQDEKITVEVDMPNPDDIVEDADEKGNEDEQADGQTSIPLVVSISKGDGMCLEFGVTAFPDEITIDCLSIKQPEGSEDQLAYEGPDFNDLDENLQKAFHKFLEIRGIKPTTTNFLHDYMINKDNKEYLNWLKNLKNFIEK